MPRVIKKKPLKKKPVKDDEVKSAAFQAIDALKKKQRHVIIGASALAVIVITFSILSFYSTSQYKKASSFEEEARKYYYAEIADESLDKEGRLKKALELYTASLNVKATPTALFYLANTHYKLGDYESAITAYNRFIDEFSSDELLLPLVYEKLALAHFKIDQNDQGLAAINKLARIDNGIFKDTALVLEARYYEQLGDSEAALKNYKEIAEGFPGSPWAIEAGSKVAAKERTEEAEQKAAELKEEKKGEEQPDQAEAEATENMAPDRESQKTEKD